MEEGRTRRRPTRSKGDRVEKRLKLVSKSRTGIVEGEQHQERTDALTLARILAIAGLPRRRTKARDLVRTIRVGASTWVRITYAAQKGTELPYGQDRFVLAGVQHLAILQQKPLVQFEAVGHLLKMFELSTSGSELALLRERFARLGGLSISMTVARTRQELDQRSEGEQYFVIKHFKLPTRTSLKRDLLSEYGGQLSLLPAGEEFDPRCKYFVLLSPDFYAHLMDAKNRLIVPMDLLKLFIDRPIAWDYLMFLVARCGAARSESLVDHDVLMEMFRDGKEPDRKVIERLRGYHDEIMKATEGRLNATLIEGQPVRSTGGRPRKRWGLKVGPSQPIVFSGTNLALPEAASEPTG